MNIIKADKECGLSSVDFTTQGFNESRDGDTGYWWLLVEYFLIYSAKYSECGLFGLAFDKQWYYSVGCIYYLRKTAIHRGGLPGARRTS